MYFRKGTVMQSSNLGAQKWVFAIYMITTGLKGTSSMKLHRDLGIRQATAWHLIHRVREGPDGKIKISHEIIKVLDVNKGHYQPELPLGDDPQ